jgi:hypothetical protein
MFEQEAQKQNEFQQGLTNLQTSFPEQFGTHVMPDGTVMPGATHEQTEELGLAEGVYKVGGKIKIKPSMRGTFTAAAKKRGMGVQEFASKVLSNKENYTPRMVKKANFARNFGGNKKQFGGEVPPTGQPKYLSQADYDAEIAKRKEAYQAGLDQYIVNALPREDVNNPAMRANIEAAYKRDNPFVTDDIAVEIPNIPVPEVGGLPPEVQGASPEQAQYGLVNPYAQDLNTGTLPPQNQGFNQPQVTQLEEGFGLSGFNYGDKNWKANSAALSKYKQLVDAGRVEEANQIVLGHFHTGNVPGYSQEAERLGKAKAIRASDLQDVISAGQESKIKDIESLFEATQFKCGGKLKKMQTGGEFPTYPANKNVLARTGEKDIWGNYLRSNPNAIAEYNKSISNLDFSSNYDWTNPEFLKTVPNLFSKADVEDYRSYYKGATGGLEYDPNITYEDILGKVNEAALSPISGNVRPAYGSTGPATLPTLAGYLELRSRRGQGDPVGGREKVGVPFVESLGNGKTRRFIWFTNRRF